MKSQRSAHRVIIGVLLALIAAGVLAQDATGTAIRVTGAWVRPADAMTAAYVHVTNDGSTADQLVGVETDAGMAEIHETTMENDVMRMRRVDEVDIPAGETVALEPGGLHIMIMNLQQPLVEGDTLSLRLIFASGIVQEVAALVSHTPIPLMLQADTLTGQSLEAAADGVYVGQVVNPPVQVQDFTAPGSDAAITHLSDTDGTWRVIFFGYMHCPDFCPLTLVDYKHAREMLGDAAEHVTFVFVSVDAMRDTPEALRRYLANFDPNFVGFSPDDATLNRIQPDYGFYYQRRMDSGSQAIYTVDHSTRSYVLDREGRLRASFAYDTDPQKIADALLWYLEHELAD